MPAPFHKVIIAVNHDFVLDRQAGESRGMCATRGSRRALCGSVTSDLPDRGPRRTLGVERVSIADPRDAGMLDVLLAPSGMSNALEPGAGAVERPL